MLCPSTTGQFLKACRTGHTMKTQTPILLVQVCISQDLITPKPFLCFSCTDTKSHSNADPVPFKWIEQLTTTRHDTSQSTRHADDNVLHDTTRHDTTRHDRTRQERRVVHFHPQDIGISTANSHASPDQNPRRPSTHTQRRHDLHFWLSQTTRSTTTDHYTGPLSSSHTFIPRSIIPTP